MRDMLLIDLIIWFFSGLVPKFWNHNGTKRIWFMFGYDRKLEIVYIFRDPELPLHQKFEIRIMVFSG